MLVDFWTLLLHQLPALHSLRARMGREVPRPGPGRDRRARARVRVREEPRQRAGRRSRTSRSAYPVAVDNDYAIWRAFGNQYWPAHYFVDAQGRIRHHHFGEGDYDESERVHPAAPGRGGSPRDDARPGGGERDRCRAPAAAGEVASPETYVGYERAERFVSPAAPRATAGSRYGAGAPRLSRVGPVGHVDDRSRSTPTLDATDGSVVLPLRAPGLHLGARSRAGRQAGALPRWRSTEPRAGPDHGADADARGEASSRDSASTSSSDSAVPSPIAHVRDPLPRPRRRGVRLHVRLTSE